MKYLHPVAAVPNALIDDTKLHYTTKRVALALLLMLALPLFEKIAQLAASLINGEAIS